MDHVLSTCKAPDADVLRWTLAKGKQIADKYTNQPPPTAHLSEVSEATFHVDEDINFVDNDNMEDEFDDTAVSVFFALVAFTSFTTFHFDLCDYWVADSPCSVNLTTFWSEFIAFQPPSQLIIVGGVGVNVKGNGNVRVPICLVSVQTVFRLGHALYTHDLTSRSAQHIGRMLNASLMQKHSGCEFLFPTDYDAGMLLVTT
jgi:hypothetical protein